MADDPQGKPIPALEMAVITAMADHAAIFDSPAPQAVCRHNSIVPSLIGRSSKADWDIMPA